MLPTSSFKKFYTILLLLFFINTCATADQLIIEPEMGRTPILSFMSSAKSSIKLAIYGLTDQRLIDALITAKNQGKNVQVLLEPKPYRAENENNSSIQQLHQNNIDCHTPNPDFSLLHQKTLLIDQNDAMIMTFNFTHSTFKKQRNFALIITDPAEVKEIQTVFAADWEHKNIAVHNPNLVWSPNNSREKIIDLIHEAHSSIKIYAEGLSDYRVIGALAKAAKAGINVQVLMSADWNKHPTKKFSYLYKSGVNLHFSKHYLIHAKVILVDQKRALLGSINLTQHSMDNNRELSVITESPDIVNELNRTFEKDWRETNFPSPQNQKKLLRFLNKLLSSKMAFAMPFCKIFPYKILINKAI